MITATKSIKQETKQEQIAIHHIPSKEMSVKQQEQLSFYKENKDLFYDRVVIAG